MVVFDAAHRRKNTTDRFLPRFIHGISRVSCCGDQILLNGHLPLRWGDATKQQSVRRELRIRDCQPFVMKRFE